MLMMLKGNDTEVLLATFIKKRPSLKVMVLGCQICDFGVLVLLYLRHANLRGFWDATNVSFQRSIYSPFRQVQFFCYLYN